MLQYPIDRESLERDCDLEFFVAGGPGGQHRNKVETGDKFGNLTLATTNRKRRRCWSVAFRASKESDPCKRRRYCL